ILLFSPGLGIIKSENNTTFTDSGDWKLRKEKDGIKVYTRNNSNSAIKEFKAITSINADIGQLVRIINDVENYPGWLANCESSRIYKKITETTRIDYMKTSVPWPLNDRDAVFEFIITKNTEEHFEATMVSVPGAIPEKEDIVRIKKAKGKWIFKKSDKKMVDITYQFYGDPEGNIPAAIINLFIVSGPYKTLLNIKNQCNSKD
ncbi:MAG: START domain-containing protein, partial [Bacteroidales bacterium]|nr:START domain-containing protein [Bacteroidales bacterium]